MSMSGPSPLGTLMVQRVEAALGVPLSQQANLATGARPDAVTQPGQPDKVDPVENPPPRDQERARRVADARGRQPGLTSLARNDPDIAKLLAARNAPMTSYTASAPTTLGQTARTILALLQQYPDADAAMKGRAPLLPQAARGSVAAPMGGSGAPATGAAASPAAGGTSQTAGASQAAGTTRAMPAQPTGIAGQLAQALSRALQTSGLFYESHLRDFAFGQRTLAQLRAEPQSQAGQEAARGPAGESGQTRGGAEGATNTGSTTTQSSSTQSGPNAPASQTTASAAQSAAAAATQSQAASAHLSGALAGLDPSTHVLVRQQLETLANQAFTWQGEAWPGAEMEWEVQRRQHEDAEDSNDNWSTRLKLQLPGLGEVHARLSLSGTQLIMHLVSPDGAEVMAEHTDLLRQRLGQQGLQLSQLTFSRDPNEEPERPV